MTVTVNAARPSLPRVFDAQQLTTVVPTGKLEPERGRQYAARLPSFSSVAVTVNVPHALNEQAEHVAHIIDEARRRGAQRIEVTPEAEQGWVDEVRDKARLGERFYAECTPGYYNNEGRLANPNGFFAGMYGAGPIRFFELLQTWRDDGGLPGLELR